MIREKLDNASLRYRQLFIIVTEFGFGVTANLSLGYMLYAHWLPHTPLQETFDGRMAIAAGSVALAALAMLATLYGVALGRFGSEAMDPLVGKESGALQTHKNVLTNTHEQLVLFAAAAAAIGALGDADSVRLLPAAAILFVINRPLYWVGYLVHPLLRGVGLSGTLYPITLLVLYAGYLAAGALL